MGMTPVRNSLTVDAPQDGLSIEQFLAFTESRPDEERWELIEGVPVMNPSPVRKHQRIAGNIDALLLAEKDRLGASWLPMLGVGTVVPASPNSLPRPDVYVQESGEADDSHITDDASVIFELLSRSNRGSDRDWRHKVHSSVPNCQHYVTIATKSVRVTVHDRSSNWEARVIVGRSANLDLPALGASLRLADIYRWTPLATSA